VSSVEGSGEHTSCPSGGDRVVDRWTLVAWEGVNILLTYRVSWIREGGAGGLNTPTREVAS
jgi:hypothetical protein